MKGKWDPARDRAIVEAAAREHAAQFEHVPDMLAALRAQIDEADVELVRVLRRRASLVESVALVKLIAGLPAHDPAREERLVLSHCPIEGPVQDAYREVIRVCRTHVQRRKGEEEAVGEGREAPVPSPDDEGDPEPPAERADGL